LPSEDMMSMKTKRQPAPKTTFIRIDADLKRRMKIEAAKRGVSMVELGRAALGAFLALKPGA
jgi:hypothetical protein